MTEAFPLEIVSSDYCFSGPSIRDERARIVTIKVSLIVKNVPFSHRLTCLPGQKLINPSQTSPGFYVSAVQVL